MEKTLIEQMRHEIMNRPARLSLRDVAEGAGVTLTWLRWVLYNAEPDSEPGAVKARRLMDFLMAEKDAVDAG